MKNQYQDFTQTVDEIIKLGGVKSKEDLVILARIKFDRKIDLKTIRKFMIKYESDIKKKLKVLGYGKIE